MISNLTRSYEYLTYHIVPGPNSISYFVPFILLPIALLIPPDILSRNQLAIFFLPLIYASQLHSVYVSGIDVISVDVALWSLTLLALRDPRRKFRRIWVMGSEFDTKALVNPPNGNVLHYPNKIVEEPYPGSLSKRLPWVLTLLVSLRLTGWRIGDPSHDRTQPPPKLSRSTFAKHAVSMSIWGYLLLDATSFYVRFDPYFSTSSMSVDAPFPSPAPNTPKPLLLLRLLPPRLLRSYILAGQLYALVTSMFFIPMLPAVGLHALGFLPDEWSPHTWPVWFGDFSAVTSRGIRGLWGSWWHQTNRQATSTPGRALARALEVSTSSILGYAFLTVSAFFFSGIIHIGLIPPQPKADQLSASVMRLYVASFFWAQIPAFAIELMVSRMVARYVPQVTNWSITKVMVLLWTGAWLCLTLPLLPVPLRELGYWKVYAVPVSLVQGLFGQGWLTWSCSWLA